ncbi:conjugal transfer protein TraI, partial [Acinetobacter baumannii]
GISAEEQRRLQEIEAARTSKMFAGTESRTISVPGVAPEGAAPPPVPHRTGLGLAPPHATPSAQDRQLAFLNAAADRRTVAPDR